MTIDKTAVVTATEEKILELAYLVSGKLSLSRVKEDIRKGAQLCKLLRVINNPNSTLTYNEVQLLLQACINLGDLTL